MNGQTVTPIENVMPLVLHMLGGQIVIGMVTMSEDRTITVDCPHEVMVTPDENTSRHHISLVPYGTGLGALPQIGPPRLVFQLNALVALPVTPHQELQEAYAKVYQRIRHPTPEQEIAGAKARKALKESVFDITKGGTL